MTDYYTCKEFGEEFGEEPNLALYNWCPYCKAFLELVPIQEGVN